MTMRDAQDRPIRYLRFSLTEACQMRCVYCRPSLLSQPCKPGRLTPGEIESVVRHLVAKHGLDKVRLTGGDPTARPDLVNIIERIAGIDGVRDLAMTTNGLSLASHAKDYATAGLGRVNVSLDSLNAERFAGITGSDTLERVLAGIDGAIDAGLTPLKLNTVVLNHANLSDLAALVEYAAMRGVEIRFIELMPMGPLAEDWAGRYVPESQMRNTLAEVVSDWQALSQGSDSAQVYDATLHDGRHARVGFITPMSCNFCSACNRLRITSDGSVYPCLMDRPRGNIAPAVRPRFDADLFDRILSKATQAKAPEHPVTGFAVMTHIGG
jgi:cyclic pyranopterin phosphate synthase